MKTQLGNSYLPEVLGEMWVRTKTLFSIVQLFYSGSQVLFLNSHDFRDSMAIYELTAWNRNPNATSLPTAPKPMKAQTWSNFFGIKREQNGAREAKKD